MLAKNSCFSHLLSDAFYGGVGYRRAVAIVNVRPGGKRN